MIGGEIVSGLKEVLARHELLWSLTVRQIRARYKQTVLGAAWAVLQPLLLMLVCTFLFGKVVRVPTDGVAYPVFAYTGLMFWSFTAVAIATGTNIVVNNSDLVRKIYFPRELLPLSVVLAGCIDVLVASTVLVALMRVYGLPFAVEQWLVLPIFGLHLTFVIGVLLITTALHVRFRDIGHALPIAMQVWMLGSPVAYPVSVVPEAMRGLYLLNPMAPVLEAYRAVLLHGRSPDWSSLALAAAISILLGVGGYAYFRHAEMTFADVV